MERQGLTMWSSQRRQRDGTYEFVWGHGDPPGYAARGHDYGMASGAEPEPLPSREVIEARRQAGVISAERRAAEAQREMYARQSAREATRAEVRSILREFISRALELGADRLRRGRRRRVLLDRGSAFSDQLGAGHRWPDRLVANDRYGAAVDLRLPDGCKIHYSTQDARVRKRRQFDDVALFRTSWSYTHRGTRDVGASTYTEISLEDADVAQIRKIASDELVNLTPPR